MSFNLEYEKKARLQATHAEAVFYNKKSRQLLTRTESDILVEISAIISYGGKWQEVLISKKSVPSEQRNRHYTVFNASRLVSFINKGKNQDIHIILNFKTFLTGQTSMNLRKVVNTEGSGARRPLLVVYHGISDIRHLRSFLKKRPKERNRREAATPIVTNKQACGIRSFFVDFAEISWDKWIIAPKGYNAQLCSGRCSYPLSANLNPNNHALVHAMIKALSKDADNIPNVCCVPWKFKPLTLMHYDASQNVIVSIWKNMIVEECACR